MTNYTPIFEIQLQHEFFDAGGFIPFHLTPIGYTVDLLKALNCVWRRKGNHYTFYLGHSGEDGLVEALAAFPADSSLFFSLEITSDSGVGYFFVNYSDLGLHKSHDNLLHFKNRVDKRLTVAAQVSEQDLVSEEEFDSIRRVGISLPGSVLGIIELSIEPIALVDQPIYTIAFRGISSYWRYYLMQAQDNSPERQRRGFDLINLTIDGQTLSFDEPEQVALTNGVLANRVTLSEPIDFRESLSFRPVLELHRSATLMNAPIIDPATLVMKKAEDYPLTTAEVRIPLPIPNIQDGIYIESLDDGYQYFHDFYIYL